MYRMQGAATLTFSFGTDQYREGNRTLRHANCSNRDGHLSDAEGVGNKLGRRRMGIA
jgi:hypothetical protein